MKHFLLFYFASLLGNLYAQSVLPSSSDVDRIFLALLQDPTIARKEVSKYQMTAYEFGIYLDQTKFGNSLQWFELLEKAYPNEPDFPFGTAWVHFNLHNIEKAQKEVVYVLSLSNTTPLIKARSQRLLADIYSHLGNYPLAKTTLNEALRGYLALNLHGGAADCHCSLAIIEYFQNNPEETLLRLDDCEKENTKRNDPSEGLCQINYIRGLVLLKKGLYSESIALFDKALSFVKKWEVEYSLAIRIDRAIALALNKDADSSLKSAREIDKEIGTMKVPNARLANYNNVAWIAALNEKGFYDENLVKKTLEWADANDPSGELRNLVLFVKKAN